MMKAAFFKLPVLLVVFVMMRVDIVHSTFFKDYDNDRYEDRYLEGKFLSLCCAAERTSIIE